MASEDDSGSEEFEVYAAGCIDFGTAPPFTNFVPMRSYNVLNEIEKDKDKDERYFHLVHRLPKNDSSGSDPETTDQNSYMKLVQKRVERATRLLSELPLPEQLVFIDAEPTSHNNADNSSGPTRVAVAHAVQDGPKTSALESQVVAAKWLFFGPDVYRMGLSPRGRCLIFNNVKFKYYKEPRFGSDHDKDRMEALFNAFLFKCDVYPDNEAHKMKELLAEAAQSEELASADCLVVIMMSHGDQNMIEGVDGDELHLVNDVYAQFNNDNCPALRGKPKLFFIQACRGDKRDTGPNTTCDKASDPRPVTPEEPHSSPLSDIYIAYASVPGYVSLRSRVTGSWFLSAVYEIFSKYACTEHLETLMKLVHAEVMTNSAGDGEKQTPSLDTQGWTKKLYFNPKKYVESLPA